MKKTLTRLISFQTVTSQIQINHLALVWCQKFLKKKGIVSRLISIDGHPLLLWGSSPQKAEILINTHIDVVPASSATFHPHLLGGKLLGRGSADSKAFASLVLGLPLSVIKTAKSKNILFSISSDEEIGGFSNQVFISKLPHLKFAIFGEPSNLRIVNQAKGIMQIRIKSSGKSAHGARPWLGKNAIILLTSNLSKFLEAHPTSLKETFSTTFNFSQISGGSAINQVPDTCELLVDVRFNSQQSPSQIISLLKEFFRDCDLETIKSESVIDTASTNTHLQHFSSCLKTCGIPPQLAFEHGSSDARHCTALHIPAIVFGPIGADLHQENEWVDLNSLNQVQQALKTFIKTI